MLFPLEEIGRELDVDKQDEMIRSSLDKCDPNDPPFLSHIIVHSDENAAIILREIIADGIYQFQWRIKVLRGEFGEELKPGDVVYRDIPINRKNRKGDLVTPRVMSLAKKDGSYNHKYEKRKQFQLDAKGCIRCGFEDAVYFLENWGYNKKTNSAVTKKPEYSYEPVDLRDSSKGQKKHIRYWRYAEMDKEDYEKLPVLTGSDKSQQGKGR